MTALSTRTLATAGTRLPVPTYDRTSVTPGIVHLGVGGFHRSHQAMYVDRLLSQGLALDWGITGVGLLPGDVAMARAMHTQDCLYTLVIKHPDGSVEPRVIGSMLDYLFAPDHPEAVLELMERPATRIVSLTITEGGYHLNEATGAFDSRDASIQADVAAFRDGRSPATAFGYLAQALARRRAAGTEPFTVMSCDNVQGNGHVARQVLVAFASLCDPELSRWIDEHVSFPNSMVDRITPATSEADRSELAHECGVEDLWPVVCEPFAQWVLQDTFSLGRPPLEQAGVQIVADVEPYELMKLRLLNISHQALCYLGYLSGYRYAHDVCQDPLFAGFLLDYMNDEATPTLAPVPGVDLDAYKHQLIRRFANPAVKDTLARLCADTSDRIPKWLVPVISQNLASGGDVRLSALIIASWARYAEGVDEEGQPIDVVDRRRTEVMARAAAQKADPLAFLKDVQLFADLATQERFTAHYLDALDSLHHRGARVTLEDWQRR